MPKVSVIIPTANRPHLLPRALASVFAQTFQDFEVIIVDDGQRVRAEDVVKQIGDKRIRYVHNETSLGGGVTRNIGAELALGEYLAFLDDDDEWFPTKLEKQVQGLDNAGPHVGAAFCGVTLFEEGSGKQIFYFLPGEVGEVDIFDRTLYRCYIWTSALMVRRSVFMDEQFDPAFTKNQEWDLQLRLAKKIKFFGVDEVLVRLYLQDEKSHMGGKSNIANIINGYELLLSKFKDDFAKAPKALARQSFLLAGLYREQGDFKRMRELFQVTHQALPNNAVYSRHFMLSSFGKSIYMAMYQLLNNNEPEPGYRYTRNTYLLLKKIPVIGSLFSHLRNVVSPFIESKRLKKQDLRAAHQVLSDLFGAEHQVHEWIEQFRDTPNFFQTFTHGQSGDFDILVLYGIVRAITPDTVVETGVASGRSSTAILTALKENNKGKLYSVDLPHFYEGDAPTYKKTSEGNDELQGYVPQGKEPGWLVPSELRDRWELTLGDSNVELKKVVGKLDSIDLFYHDSEHSYETMMFEFTETWDKIRKEGYLLADDIRWNDSWKDFLAKHQGTYSFMYRNFGILRK
jgi:glycosyltransferase involved in cell wall biosynthesis/predicted O-methyltransferase YrrM